MRGIKPETFTDDKILQVSPLARWLFIGMWTQACDNGHVEDNHVQLKVRLLPMDSCDVHGLVSELISQGLLIQGEGFLKVPNLTKHQKMDRRFLVFCKWCDRDEEVRFSPSDKLERYSKSNVVHDEEDASEGAVTSGTRRVHDVQATGTQRALVDEGEGEGEGELNPSSTADAEDEFAEWYSAYPRKEAKGAARKAFKTARKKTSLESLMAGLTRYTESIQGKERTFIALPGSWLNAERWEDEIPNGTHTAPPKNPLWDT